LATVLIAGKRCLHFHLIDAPLECWDYFFDFFVCNWFQLKAYLSRDHNYTSKYNQVHARTLWNAKGDETVRDDS